MVDVYTEWSGPCTAMQATLKRAKLEVLCLDDGQTGGLNVLICYLVSRLVTTAFNM